MITKCVQIDGWIFEVKAVRALKVERYGQPYSAIANINLSGDSAYIDGIMTKDQHELSPEDLTPMVDCCRQLKLTTVEVDYFQAGKKIAQQFAVQPPTHVTPLAIAHSG